MYRTSAVESYEVSLQNYEPKIVIISIIASEEFKTESSNISYYTNIYLTDKKKVSQELQFPLCNYLSLFMCQAQRKQQKTR